MLVTFESSLAGNYFIHWCAIVKLTRRDIPRNQETIEMFIKLQLLVMDSLYERSAEEVRVRLSPVVREEG